MVRILHTADLHLDSAFVGLSEDAARARRAGQRQLLQDIVDLANEAEIDLLLLAGDILDGGNAYADTAAVLAASLAKCRAHVFLACGNHDPYDANSPLRAVRFSENVHLFCREQMESVELPSLNCVVHGAGFSSSVCETSLLEGFSAPRDGKLHLLVLHGECTEGGSTNNPIRKRDLEKSGVRYAALGHIHKRSEVLYAGDTAYAYPGCPEGRGFDECGQKGVLIGSLDTEQINLQFLPIFGPVYEEKVLKLSDGEDAVARLSALLPEQDEKLHLRVILEGESDGIDCEALTRALSHRVAKLVLKDRTRPKRGVWDGENEPGLKGEFLRRLHTQYDAAEEAERETILRAAELGVAALENREDV